MRSIRVSVYVLVACGIASCSSSSSSPPAMFNCGDTGKTKQCKQTSEVCRTQSGSLATLGEAISCDALPSGCEDCTCAKPVVTKIDPTCTNPSCVSVGPPGGRSVTVTCLTLPRDGG